MTGDYPCLLQLKPPKLYTAIFFLMLESSATCSLSIWEPGIAYGPQGHISESAALCGTATVQLICNILLRMCKMIQSIKIVVFTSSISTEEGKKKCFLRYVISAQHQKKVGYKYMYIFSFTIHLNCLFVMKCETFFYSII